MCSRNDTRTTAAAEKASKAQIPAKAARLNGQTVLKVGSRILRDTGASSRRSLQRRIVQEGYRYRISCKPWCPHCRKVEKPQEDSNLDPWTRGSDADAVFDSEQVDLDRSRQLRALQLSRRTARIHYLIVQESFSQGADGSIAGSARIGSTRPFGAFR